MTTGIQICRIETFIVCSTSTTTSVEQILSGLYVKERKL